MTDDDDPIVAFIARQPDLPRRLLVEHVDDGADHCQVCTGGDWPCNITFYVMQASHAKAAGTRPSSAPSVTS